MHIAQNWRINAQRYALKGLRCEKCQQVTFPPREVCPYCAAVDQAAEQKTAINFPLNVTRGAGMATIVELSEPVALQRAGR